MTLGAAAWIDRRKTVQQQAFMKKPAKKSSKITTQRQLSELLDRDESTISRWLRDDHWSFKRTAPWLHDDVPAILRWAAETMGNEDDPGLDPALRELRRQKLLEDIRRVKAVADTAELSLSRERRELLPISEVKDWISTHVQGAKSRLMALPARVAHQLEGHDAAERQTILEKAVREALEDLSEGIS